MKLCESKGFVLSDIPLPPPLDAATPDDFFTPGLDDGMFLVRGQDKETHRIAAPQIDFLSLSSIPDHRLRAYGQFWRREKWSQCVVFPTLLTVAENVVFTGKYISIGGKYLLSGAPASRLRNEYAIVGPVTNDMSPDMALTEKLRELSFRTPGWPRNYSGSYQDLDLLIQAKNFHNYYHFTREALHLLTLYQKLNLTGRIMICRSDKSYHDFTRDAVKAWFPGLAERVEFLPHLEAPLGFERVLLPFVPLHYYFQCRERVIPAVTDVGVIVKRRPDRSNIRVMDVNSCESSLVALNRLTHTRILQRPQNRRLYIVRKSGRDRRVVNEDLFTDNLRKIGFEHIAFEDYTVQEQGQLMAQAQIVIGQHGAGLSNMVYARPGCHVVELTNLQTIRARFGDFDGFATASGAHYHHLVLDHDFEDPENPDRVPRIAGDGHRGVVFTPFTASVAFAYVYSLLYPQETAALFARCEALHSKKNKTALEALLNREGDKLAHLADVYVWRANIAADKRDRPAVLHHLLNALVLAPRRPVLVRRVLSVARELHDDDAFSEALLHLQRYTPDEVELFFREKGWPLPEPAIAPQDDEAEEDVSPD